MLGLIDEFARLPKRAKMRTRITVIGRFWKAWTTPNDANAYEDLLRGEILPELDAVDGCIGAYVLRRNAGNEVEFAVLHFFDSFQALQDFGGDDYETAVVPDSARRLLKRFEPTATHYDVRESPHDQAP